jgi:hypothetical protein
LSSTGLKSRRYYQDKTYILMLLFNFHKDFEGLLSTDAVC